MAKLHRYLRFALALATLAIMLFLCLQFVAIDVKAPAYSRQIVLERLCPLLWILPAYAILAGITVAAKRKSPEVEKQSVSLSCTMPGSAFKFAALQNPLRIALWVAAIVFIVLGVMNGGARDVLIKAINICTECIGLG